MKALLFSGGIDSTALAWGLKPEKLLFVDYGQIAARGELRAASAIARELGTELDVRHLSMRSVGSGTMAGDEPLNASAPEFWPYRNQALITFAAMAYAGQSLDAVIIGTVKGDDSRHADGKPEFIDAMERLLRVQNGPSIEAPAMNFTTERLVKEFGVPRSVLGWAFSCHTGEWACGTCAGCLKHAEVKSHIEGGTHDLR